MAGEISLEPVRVKIIVETVNAPKGDEISPSPDQSRPGVRPPEPGKRDDCDCDDPKPGPRPKPKPEPKPKPGTPSVPGSKIYKTALGAVKTIASATALSITADAVPAMIDEKLKQLDADDVFSRAVLKVIEYFIGVPLTKIGDGIRAIEAAMPVLTALIGGATDVARSASLLNVPVSAENTTAIAARAAAVASAEVGIGLERRRLGRAGVGIAILEQRDQIMELFGVSK